MTAASGLKRVGVALAALLIGGACLLAVMSFLISADAAREAVKSEIRAVTGLDPVLRGPGSVSLFPSGSVSFDDVVIGDDHNGNSAVTAERLTARLRFFSLLFGKVQVADVTLVRPAINLTIQPDGKTNWTPLVSALRPTANRPASFSEIRIEDGTIIVRDDSRGLMEKLNSVQMSLAWPSMFRGFTATGSFVWHGEPVNASLNLADLIAALDGNPAGLKLRLSGAPLNLVFEGQFTSRPALKVEGVVAADSASLREALRWTAQKQVPSGGFGRFALKAKTKIAGGTIEMSAVNVELDGNAAEGVLTYASNGRQTLQGTLAAETLDIGPYVSTIRLLAGAEREWSRAPITLDGFTGFDLDFRLSAAQVKTPGAKLGRTAVAANLRGGKLTLTVGESQAFGGIVQGSLDLAKVDGGASIETQVQFTDVDLDKCFGALFGMQHLEGKGTFALGMKGSGASVMALTKTLDGSATLSGRQGAITGVDVEQLLRRLERRPLSGAGDFRSGRTPYEKLMVKLSIVQGTVKAEEARVDGQAIRLALGGSASIPARDLELSGTASLVSASGAEGNAGFELPFLVRGSWEEPLMLLDTQSLLRRAPAAAPLLDAVRDRRAREAVRSAIDQMVSDRPTPVPATVQP